MKNESSSSEWREIFSRACDGTLSDREAAILAQSMESHPELIDHYVNFLANEAAIDVTCGKAFLDLPVRPLDTSVPSQKPAAKPRPQAAAQNRPRRRQTHAERWPAWRRSIAAWLPYAVSLAILLGIVGWWIGRPGAVLVASDDARWADGIEREVGTKIDRDWLELEQGSVNLAFRSGAQAIVQAPARFRVASTNSCELSRGVLSAHVPEPAEGFVVSTPEVTIVDLGTSFRVNSGAEGRMNCHVTEGRVKLARHGRSQSLTLEAGNVASLNDPAEEISIEIQPKVIAASDVHFVAEHPPSLGYKAYVRDDEIAVFLESQRLVLSQNLRVNVMQPGLHNQLNSLVGQIDAGTMVDCYLVHCAPQRQRHVVEGRITFPGRILGLVCDSDLLNSTNSVLGASWTLKCQHNERGLESVPDRNSDVVTLSSDRRSLSLRLRTESIDQLRVLVSAE